MEFSGRNWRWARRVEERSLPWASWELPTRLPAATPCWPTDGSRCPLPRASPLTEALGRAARLLGVRAKLMKDLARGTETWGGEEVWRPHPGRGEAAPTMTGAFARASLEPRGSAHRRGLGASLRVKPQVVLGGTQQRVESVPTSSQGPGSSVWCCLACCIFWDGGSPASPHLLTQCLESCGESWEMDQTGLGLRPARVALGQSPALSEPDLHTWGVDVRRQEVTVEGLLQKRASCRTAGSTGHPGRGSGVPGKVSTTGQHLLCCPANATVVTSQALASEPGALGASSVLPSCCLLTTTAPCSHFILQACSPTPSAWALNPQQPHERG
ncbi:uncharacterized protein LOC115897659 [Rhinopithecus roxellana]|uniref:uncharacterized protein LOC115897659 n=1 Tax=Rhinopithecus roxellana TaxID=61622 RepID=UPI0012379C17|nr:uncharacterized protein LOC115897659 [Rhinopithecus roxellana]